MEQIAPEALRAARAILKWSTRQLAAESGVSWTTINAIENGRPYRAGTAARLVETFTAHGVEVLGVPTPGARCLPA